MGNLLVFLREDKKLHRLALIIHHPVEHQALDNHCTQTEYHHPTSGINSSKPVDKHRTANNANINDNQGLAKGYIMIFVDYRSYNISSARTSII